MSDTLILEARNIFKRYAGNIALDHVNFRVYRSAVNVLIGENGAGKSTLMRILAGVEVADGGDILLEGNPIVLRSPRDATSHGISIVHQELAVLPNLDVCENIFAGREMVKSTVMVDRRQQDVRSDTALNRLHKRIPANTLTGNLSLGCRQVVELARTLVHGTRILILDEPTSALSEAEASSLFQVIAELKQSGVTIVYISHRLHELLHLGDYFTVFRSGHVTGEAARADVTRQWIVERMSGHAETQDRRECSPAKAEAVLQVSDLSLASTSQGEATHTPLQNISFTLHKGEILGVYGLLGAGRTELLETLAGNRNRFTGEVTLHGRRLALDSVYAAVQNGIALVPEDRQRDGLIPELSIRENVALAASNGLLLSHEKEAAQVRQLAADLNIRAHNLELPVTALSGGNQQKVLLARCLMRSPAVLLLDEPTRGVDVGAKAEIYRILRQLADGGLSILFTSSEIEETRTLCDRALVLCQGRISAEFPREQISDESLFAAASPNVHATTVTAA
ncbi:MAG: sugar ABC transporter ATP-binding protein [Acidobacteriaceae bacterium]